MGSYQGAVAGASLRGDGKEQWGGRKRKVRFFSFCRLEQRRLNVAPARLSLHIAALELIRWRCWRRFLSPLQHEITQYNKCFHFFFPFFFFLITPTRVLGQMSAVHREWIENQVGALAHRPAAQSTSYLYRMQILAAHGTLEKYIGLENRRVFRTHAHYLGNWKGKPVMKKVCASALLRMPAHAGRAVMH